MIYYAVACDPYYLEHSGVKGMRWGHRKYPEAYYARAMRKMGRIDRAIDRNELRSARYAYKAAKFKSKGSSRAQKKANKYELKSTRAKYRAEKLKRKGSKKMKRIQKKMKNVNLSNLDSATLEASKRYVSKYM